jgi:type 1 glutamine amidotransferase
MSNQRNANRDFNRRDLLKTGSLAAAGLALSPFFSRLGFAADATGPAKKILFFTKSSGFQHSVITRNPADPDKLAYAEQILTDLGAKNGFEVTCSKDGTIFTSDQLGKFDAFVFYTTGDLTQDSDKYEMVAPADDPKGKKTVKGKLIHKEQGMGAAGKANLLEAIKSGKGFMALHCGSDTFHGKHGPEKELIRDQNEKGEDMFDPYIQMLGGEFIIHGAQQPSTLHCVDPKFPGASGLDNTKWTEEWYSLKNFAPDLHVIMMQDTEGMKGPMYQRAPFPETWARMHGKGRVFFSSLGHREDVWKKPEYEALLIGALNWTTGLADADVTPNIKTIAPEADPKPFPVEPKKAK